ncbi:hypothetical protein DRN85_04510 [Methanosarcinales archaeon]|nr:MAG: hypothetical protein DRN85_04510 [Methanosarcinales archaeon]
MLLTLKATFLHEVGKGVDPTHGCLSFWLIVAGKNRLVYIVSMCIYFAEICLSFMNVVQECLRDDNV